MPTLTFLNRLIDFSNRFSVPTASNLMPLTVQWLNKDTTLGHRAGQLRFFS